MSKEEKITPVTEDEMDDIRVTLELDDGDVECRILTIFEVEGNDYIALLPLTKNGEDNPDGDVYLYGYSEDEQGLPELRYIDDEEEYEIATDAFDQILDDEMFDEI